MKKLHISKIDADTIEYGDISTESKFDFTKVTIKDASTFYGGAALAFIQRPAHYADYITAPYN